MTALLRAAAEGHVDTVRCLVDEGADINEDDEHGVSESDYTADYESYCKFVSCSQVTRQKFLCPLLIFNKIICLSS